MASKQCRRCGGDFSPTRPNQQFCSASCSQASRAEREKIYQKNRKERDATKNRVADQIPSQREQKNQNKQSSRATETKDIAAAIKEACIQAEQGKVTIIDIAKDLPETLTNWDLFTDAYYSHVGTVIKFVKIDGLDHWSILKETDREMWTVAKWTQWLDAACKKEERTEAFYLVDIPVCAIHAGSLRQNPLIDAFSFGGKMCLTQYIKMYSEDIPTPDLKFKAFIAPPWGNILTFPHKDGFGTQLAVHCCVIGSGYNLVHYWPKLNSSQDIIFRQVTNLPPTGTKQKAPHKLDFVVDGSADIWDVELERKLNEAGIPSNSVKVSPGQTIILPPDQYHCFKKIFPTKSNRRIPLVGLACDCTYVGATEESFNSYYQSIKAIQRVHHWPSHIFCILELALYCLFHSLISLPSMMDDDIFRAHIKGAYPLFVSWVQSQLKDATRVMELMKYKEEDIIKIRDFEEELFCHECKFPLVNLFITTSSKTENENKLCVNCLTTLRNAENSKKKGGSSHKKTLTDCHLKARFASPGALEHLLMKIQRLLGKTEQSDQGSHVAEEITHDFVSDIITRNQEVTDQVVESVAEEDFPLEGIELDAGLQLPDDQTALMDDINYVEQFNRKPNVLPASSSNKPSPATAVRKPLKFYTKQNATIGSEDPKSEELQKSPSLFPLQKRKLSGDEGDMEQPKKKIKLDTFPGLPLIGTRLSDDIINEYLDRKKSSASFKSSWIFTTFYYENFESGRSEEWSLPYLFDYESLIFPIFDRQGEHWRLAILTNPKNLLLRENKITKSPSGLFVFDSIYDTSIVVGDIKDKLLRILWKNLIKKNPSTELSMLADENLVIYPMKTCRQKNIVDCGVFVLHFIEEFVQFKGPDAEQYRRKIWTVPLNVEEKRREISNTLKERTKLQAEGTKQGMQSIAPQQKEASLKAATSESNKGSLVNENNPRFKFNVFTPDEHDLKSLKELKGLVSASILDQYLLHALQYDKSQFLIIPAHYSELITRCDEDVVFDYSNLISSKYILLPIHRNVHWVLLIITDVSNVLQHAGKSSCNVFLLDSYHEYKLEANFFNDLVIKLLSAAVKIHTKNTSFNAKKISFSSLPVVQQTNGYDCGLYLLHNVETFINSPFSTVQQFTDDPLWKKSFKPKVRRKLLHDRIVSTLKNK